jgi:hypothetical protein
VSPLADDPDDPRPVMPLELEAAACCQSGCDPCVYDRYWDEMNRYEQTLAEWEIRRSAAKAAIKTIIA